MLLRAVLVRAVLRAVLVRTALALASGAALARAVAQEEPRPVLEGLAGAARAPLSGALEDVSAAGIAFVELALERDTFLVREPVTLRLRFGFEAAFLRSNLVQLFQRELDVPAQLSAPWLLALEGAVALERAEPAGGVRVALGEEVVLAAPLGEERRGERTYRVFELARAFVPTQSGELALEGPLMRFAHATRFEDDFVQGRLPLDRRDVLVRGPGARLAVRPLPEEGRPPEFSGAIGRFSLRAEAEPRELVAGGGLVLSVVVEAEGELGDLSQAVEPSLGELDGFHLRGSLVEREARRLSVRYDLVPAGPEVRAIPPVRFAYFDTTPPAGYRALASEPIPIVVHPAVEERAPPAPRAAPGSGRARALYAALLVLAIGAAAYLLRRARRA